MAEKRLKIDLGILSISSSGSCFFHSRQEENMENVYGRRNDINSTSLVSSINQISQKLWRHVRLIPPPKNFVHYFSQRGAKMISNWPKLDLLDCVPEILGVLMRSVVGWFMWQVVWSWWLRWKHEAKCWSSQNRNRLLSTRAKMKFLARF